MLWKARMYGFVHSPVSLLMSALSDALGQSVDLERDDDECVLEFDRGLEVAIAQRQEMQVISLRSPLTQAGQPLSAALLQQALSLNYTRLPPGYSIALDAADGRLMLIALIDADHTAADHFVALAAGFLEMVPGLREQCAEPQESAAPLFKGPEVFA